MTDSCHSPGLLMFCSSSGEEWPDVGGDLSDGQLSLAWFVDVLQLIGGGLA